MKKNKRGAIPDGMLIQGFLNGKTEDFDELYARYKKQLYSYLNRLAPSAPELVDDIFQQTWIRIIHQLPKYKIQHKFLSWAMRIAHNLFVDDFRKEKHARQAEPFQSSRIDAGNSPEAWRDLDRRELRDALSDAVDQLSLDQREVFLMRQDGLSFKEIADIQGVSINTALGRMQYALKNLRNLLKTWEKVGTSS